MKFQPGAIRYPVYQISNPQDLSTTYYVQVVVKRASDLSVVAILNLVSQGNGLFGGIAYQIPQDPSGQGYELFETTSVYTDSGYTTLSANYEILNTPIDVGYQITNASGLGGGGGFDLTDYKTIRKIIAEELSLLIGNLPKNQVPTVNVNTSSFVSSVNDILNLFLEHKKFIADELKAHRESVVSGFESMNNRMIEANDAITKIPLNKAVEILNSHIGKVSLDVSELTKNHASLAKNFNGLSELHQGSLKGLAEENRTLALKHRQEINDILADYFASIHTLVVDKDKGVPKIERKKEDPDYSKIASSFFRQQRAK